MTINFQGKKESDSCEPGSSILDVYSDQGVPVSHVTCPVTRVTHDISICRESEADTSKDVSDIESDWDDDLIPDIDNNTSDNKVNSANPRSRHTSTVIIKNDKRSIFIPQKKIKKFSL